MTVTELIVALKEFEEKHAIGETCDMEIIITGNRTSSIGKISDPKLEVTQDFLTNHAGPPVHACCLLNFDVEM